MFENVSSFASHFLQDKSSEAWRKNNPAAPKFIGVALLWDRLKSHCPQSFWIVGINRNEVFCLVCVFCLILHNDLLLYFQEFNCINNRNQNTTFKAFKCCLIKYVWLSVHGFTSRCSVLLFSRGRMTILCIKTSTDFESLPPPCSSFHFFILLEQAGKPERCHSDTVPYDWMWDYFDPIKLKMMLLWKLLVLQSLMGCHAGKASY